RLRAGARELTLELRHALGELRRSALQILQSRVLLGERALRSLVLLLRARKQTLRVAAEASRLQLIRRTLRHRLQLRDLPHHGIPDVVGRCRGLARPYQPPGGDGARRCGVEEGGRDAALHCLPCRRRDLLTTGSRQLGRHLREASRERTALPAEL